MHEKYYLPHCQIGKLDGLLSTSHFKLTAIPSNMGFPNPGKRVMANDGVSGHTYKTIICIWTMILFFLKFRFMATKAMIKKKKVYRYWFTELTIFNGITFISHINLKKYYFGITYL